MSYAEQIVLQHWQELRQELHRMREHLFNPSPLKPYSVKMQRYLMESVTRSQLMLNDAESVETGVGVSADKMKQLWIEGYPEFIMLLAAPDTVVKRHILNYLLAYAPAVGSDMALMALNTLKKELESSTDPIVRWLVCKLLVILCGKEHRDEVVHLLHKSWKTDVDVKVKSQALEGLILLGESITNQQELLENNRWELMLTTFFSLTRTHKEVLTDRLLMMTVLKRVPELHPTSQATVLSLIARNLPSSDEADDLIEMLNLLDERLQHVSLCVVVATGQLFLEQAKSHPNLHRDILLRLKVALIPFVNSGNALNRELCLTHLMIIARHIPDVFKDIDFYTALKVQNGDSDRIKQLKLRLLCLVVPESDETMHRRLIWPHIATNDRDLSAIRIFIKRSQFARESFLSVVMETKTAATWSVNYLEFIMETLLLDKKLCNNSLLFKLYAKLHHSPNAALLLPIFFLLLSVLSPSFPDTDAIFHHALKNCVINETLDTKMSISLLQSIHNLPHVTSDMEDLQRQLRDRLLASSLSASQRLFLETLDETCGIELDQFTAIVEKLNTERVQLALSYQELCERWNPCVIHPPSEADQSLK